VQTADGLNDPASGFMGNTLLAVRFETRGLADSFTPSNWRNMNAKDLDLGSGSPTIFPFKGHSLVATGAKEGVVYLLDANALGGGPPEHSKPLYATPKLGNENDVLAGNGIWGAMSSYENAAGERYIYIPMWGPQIPNGPAFKYINGDTSGGSI